MNVDSMLRMLNEDRIRRITRDWYGNPLHGAREYDVMHDYAQSDATLTRRLFAPFPPMRERTPIYAQMVAETGIDPDTRHTGIMQAYLDYIGSLTFTHHDALIITGLGEA